MYTVLLTDDEVSITESLKSSIPWASLGIDKIFTAVDGIQALEIFHTQNIDLLITDIKMPRMDGLTLLAHVRKKYPNTRCILLTAYGEFEYARSGFRLGVENYLLKPLQINEITETIETAVDNMHAHQENRDILFLENILRRWLSGNISDDDLAERASILNINIYQSTYCVICMSKKDDTLSLSGYGNECMKTIQPIYDCYHVLDNQGHYIMIIGGSSISRQLLKNLFVQTAQSLDIIDKVKIAIGTVISNSQNLPISYQCASKLLEQQDETPPSIMICPEEDLLAAESIIPSLDGTKLSPIIQKAIDYIHTGYSGSVSIKEFCTKYIMTTAYIGYLFKKETNVFFNNYLNSYRISKAIELLNTTSHKINTIAEKTGFTNTSYFITSFKKYTGVSPQKYREQNKI